MYIAYKFGLYVLQTSDSKITLPALYESHQSLMRRLKNYMLENLPVRWFN